MYRSNAKTLYIIGNGFDLYHGAESSYWYFREYLLRCSIVFGYGDELDDEYKTIVKYNENEFLKNIKSFRYLEDSIYKQLNNFIESEKFQILILGHSCGNSDRVLLNTLFNHKNCISIKPYYYINERGEDNYSELTMNISRNFNSPVELRSKVVIKKYCKPLQ